MLEAKPYFLQAPVIPNRPACEKGFLAPLTQQLFMLQAQSSTGSTNSGLWGAVWIACVQKQARKSLEGGINLIPSHCRALQQNRLQEALSARAVLGQMEPGLALANCVSCHGLPLAGGHKLPIPPTRSQDEQQSRCVGCPYAGVLLNLLSQQGPQQIAAHGHKAFSSGVKVPGEGSRSRTISIAGVVLLN